MQARSVAFIKILVLSLANPFDLIPLVLHRRPTQHPAHPEK
jgi:hypothetical protein